MLNDVFLDSFSISPNIIFFDKELENPINHEFFSGCVVYIETNTNNKTQWHPCILFSFRKICKSEKSKKGDGYLLTTNPTRGNFWWIHNNNFIKLYEEKKIAFISSTLV